VQREPFLRGRILIVDDQEEMVASIRRTLRAIGCLNVESTSDPLQVLAIYDRFQPDLILLDLRMPHLDGLAIMKHIKSRTEPRGYLPVLVLTGDLNPEARQAALALGAKDFLVKPCDPIELQLRVKNLLETRYLYVQLQARNETLEQAVRSRTADLEQAQTELVSRLGAAAVYRDHANVRHAGRVGRVAALIARDLGLPPDQVNMIGQAAPLHDVGMIGIADETLRKPEDELTPEQAAAMRAHTVLGARILGGSSSNLLHLAEVIALYHHENWDGTGYGRVKGDEIPLAARITAVADAFDTMTQDRRRLALSVPDARQEIERLSGVRFDPAVVAAFLRIQPAQLLPDLTRAAARQTPHASVRQPSESRRKAPVETQ